jgi:hypothetical protein
MTAQKMAPTHDTNVNNSDDNVWYGTKHISRLQNKIHDKTTVGENVFFFNTA